MYTPAGLYQATLALRFVRLTPFRAYLISLQVPKVSQSFIPGPGIELLVEQALLSALMALSPKWE